MSGFAVADPAGVELGEHPVWDPVCQRVGWVDVLGGVLRWVHSEGVEEVSFPAPLGAVAVRRGGGVVAAAGDGIHFRDASGREDREPIGGVIAEAERFNDAACDPQGNFLCGTVALDGRPGGGNLFRISPDGEVEVLEAGVTESNGLAWSHDGATMYYVDSGEPAVRSYGYRPDGSCRRARDLCTVPAQSGVPDGICIDAGGALWVGIWAGAALWRVSPDGRLLATVPTPVSRPTCPTFGGAHMQRLYVATAWEGLDEVGRQTEPWAGHLLVCEPGVKGVPAHAFAG